MTWRYPEVMSDAPVSDRPLRLDVWLDVACLCKTRSEAQRAVKGGKVYGKWPGLEREQLYQGRDLAITTDFRDVFVECLTGHMGARDVSRVFPGHQSAAPLGLIRA